MEGESFVRYYLNDSVRLVAQQMQDYLASTPQLSDWLWIPIDAFDYTKSRGYLPGSNETEIEYVRRKCFSVVEHHNPKLVVGSSFISTYGKQSPATVIDDLLTLYSIAESKYIYARVVETLLPGDNLRITQRPVAPLNDLRKVVEPLNLQSFITESLSKLQHKTWEDDSGFAAAIHWYRQAQQSFRAAIFPLELSLYWIVLEILALAYIQGKNLETKITKKKERVKEFVASQNLQGGPWDFLDAAIDDWYEARCASFHEGKLPVWSDSRCEQRWRQLVEFVSFILADILQKQDPVHANQIAVRLSGY